MVVRVAIVGAGRLGQYYAEAYGTFKDTTVVAVVEPNAERALAVCQKFGIAAHFADIESMLKEAKPEVVTIVTPGRYFKDSVMAAARAGCGTGGSVRAVQVEKPFGGPVADADDMADACAEHGVAFAGGALSVAYPQVQEAAARLRAGEYGTIVGASIHGWSGEILGAGCQHTSVLRLLTGSEVAEVVAWCEQLEGMRDSQGRLVDAVDGAEEETGCR
jgi:predicted dehydrogenase